MAITRTDRIGLEKPDYEEARYDLILNRNFDKLDELQCMCPELAEELSAVQPVDVFIYDTTKDSDGGLWRERCQALSWYNETLNTATRGASRKFPAVVAIIFEATQYTIFDLTDPSAPMWRVKAISGTISSGAMLNGLIVVGTGAGVYRYNYISEVEETITA